jgi:hypothetical protein
MKVFKIVTLLFLALFIQVFNVTYAQNRNAGNYKFETECLGVEMDGSQTLKSWGEGKNNRDAIEQAKKIAVRDVIFKGIRNGKSDCEPAPLVGEVNAQKKYEYYFNKFFADGGDFKEFVTSQDQTIADAIFKDKKKADNGVQIGVIVRVLRIELKEKLIKDNILKQQ